MTDECTVLPTVEWFCVAPDGQNILTRYYAPTVEEAWEQAGRSCVVRAEGPARIAEMKRQGFVMSRTKPERMSNATGDTDG